MGISNGAAIGRAGATGKGREGDKSPFPGTGKEGIYEAKGRHALRPEASADY